MKHTIKKAEVIFDQDGVVGKQILKQSKLEYVQLIIEAGAGTETHVQDVLMTFYIVSGSAKVLVENEEFMANDGDLVEIKAGLARKWQNVGQDKLILFVVKVLN